MEFQQDRIDNKRSSDNSSSFNDSFPKTFVWGDFLMAAGILLIICFHLLDKDVKGVLIELPFLLLNMVITYLQYPLKMYCM